MSKLDIPNLSVLKQGIEVGDSNASKSGNALNVPADLANHRGFNHTFQQGKLTFGLISPFKGYANSHIPEQIDDIGNTAQLAEKLGFSTLWIRDVPFFDPHFGDVAHALDPFITLGYLAAKTQTITLATAGIVAPLRSPIHIAKAAASMDILTDNRFVLGLAGGDRPIEYPVFQENFDNRGERFRESVAMIRTLLSEKFPVWQGEHYGRLDGSLDLIPKPKNRMPIVTIGRARQDLEWLATESDAWVWYTADGKKAEQTVNTLAQLGDGKTWKPFAVGGFVELLDDVNAPARLYNNVYLRGGSKAIAEFYEDLRQNGVSHIALNLKPTNRPAVETLQDLAQNVLSRF